ncbi:MAG: SUMF1/EgtB/PvdO family nonheme iron enzyme [Armatimonadota bacterium]
MCFRRQFLFVVAFALLAAAGARCAEDPISTGTGFVVNAGGYLLTCAHVVKDAGKIQVTLDGKTYDAMVLGEDEKHDLALLQIRATGLRTLALANSNAVEVGMDARAYGYPLSSMLGDDIKVTKGTVAGISNQGGIKAFQIDAAVNAGNSGGPLLNEMGDVIGVVNAKLVGNAVTSVGFAVPINYTKTLLRDEGVDYLPGKAAVKLAGTALVKKASPSVALVMVWGKGPLVNSKGGAMVSIPAGSFLMGNNGSEPYSSPDELPQHAVYLSAYSIGKYEVTRGEYRAFMTATGRAAPWYWAETQTWTTETFTQTENHPVVGVTYDDAEAYCAWAGGRLPTEAEWEKAARWTGSYPNVYPWGDTWDAEKCNNYHDHNSAGGGYGRSQTAPVGSYPSGASPYGCQDMAGSVWEWCKDWYSDTYYSQSPSTNPQGPTSGSYRVLRGGSWIISIDFSGYRPAYRNSDSPNMPWYGYGFRLAR